MFVMKVENFRLLKESLSTASDAAGGDDDCVSRTRRRVAISNLIFASCLELMGFGSGDAKCKLQ
jgi:hypothetical protein